MNADAAKKIADRYIGRDGSDPNKSHPVSSEWPYSLAPRVRILEPVPFDLVEEPGSEQMSVRLRPREQHDAENLAAVLFFIGGHHPFDLAGGRRASEALAGLSVITGIPVDALCIAIGWDRP